MQKILFATSEVYPLIKTGGLADVAASLPRALCRLGYDVKIILPAYNSVLEKAAGVGLKQIAQFIVDGETVTIRQTRLPGTKVPVWLVDTPVFSERVGNPYCGADGNDWPGNHKRFATFCKAIEIISLNQANMNWQPDIVHCNDWQTGLVPALLSLHPHHIATVFTIHNLAYRGLFSHQAFTELNLPTAFWHHERLEFYGQLSFIKGGIAFADYVTTVSPSYAREIQKPEFGCGLDGLLRYRTESLAGILNGIDLEEWNPANDSHLVANYNRRTLGNKCKNKTALQERLGLEVNKDIPLLGFIGRLVDQKGVELILSQLPRLLESNYQLAILGSGFKHYEQSLLSFAEQHPRKIAVHLGYDEALAHMIEAGSDIFLMPSIFEPCGLNQMYSLRYGTLPVVHAVGGLKDTVFELPFDKIDSLANGFVFHHPDGKDLFDAIERAALAYQHPAIWKQLQTNAMSQDFSWEQSAKHYAEIYTRITATG